MTRLRQRGVVAIVAMLAISVGVACRAAAEDNKAVVHGASKLFVRRGPGMSFPPFARLSEGSVVKVHGQQGSWVRIETAGGQVGFVNTKYLTPVGEGELAAAPPTEAELLETPTEAPTSPPSEATAAPAAPDTPVGKAKASPASATRAAGGTLLPPETPLDTPTRPTMADERVSIADEVRRLSEAVVVLEKRIGESEPIGDGFGEEEDEESSVSGGAILLALLGIGFGWYVGSRYGRAQERGRRSRIRF